MSTREEFPPHVQRAITQAEKMQKTDGVDWHIVPTTIAKGRIAKPRGMNKLEADFGEHLGADPDTAWLLYEGVTLKLADDTRYTPDWDRLNLATGELEFYECKGFKRDDAMVKLKVAARMFPLRFFLVTREGDKWIVKAVTP